MPTSLIRVLVVEDFESFRRSVVSMLQRKPELQVICEVSDGLEAVRKAQELQPHLVLLDIGLPKLNGIEVARQIRQLCPGSKIVFISQESSNDIVQAALALGKGYVFKADAGIELLKAVDAVLRDENFVSSSLMGHDVIHSKNENTGDHPERKKVAPLRPGNVAIRHEVAFYPDDAAFVDGLARVMGAALKVGNAAIVIATEQHRVGILERFRADTVDVDTAIEQGRYIQLDALDTLSMLMINDRPDPVRCANMVGDLIMKAANAIKGERPRIAICGECAPTLLSEGNVEGAIQLEHLWNEATKNHNADTLCGYLWSGLPRKESISIFERICAEHSAVVGRELGY